MKHIIIGLLLLLSSVAHSQLITDSILIGDHYRTFSYNKPATNITGGSLLFVMHGSGGRASDMIKPTTNLQAIAGTEKLLIIYPEGYLHYWNECRKFSTAEANKINIDEGTFFTAMIKTAQQKFGISKEKVFAAGISGGGQMAYKLALTMPDKIKGIAAIVANLPDSASCDCTYANKPLPVLIINGTSDGTNPYNGGEMFVNNASYGVVRSTENTFAYWATVDGYKGNPEKTLLPDTDTADHKTIESYSYHQPDKPGVTLLKVINGNHGYPGDIDTYMYVWQFFKSQNVSK